MKQQVSVIISDLDNTFYDWVEMWYQAFNPMLHQLAQESNIDEDTLKAQIQAVFQEHGTSEYEFLITELPILREKYPTEDLAERFGSVIQAYQKAREANMQLYPTVAETLKTLKQIGCRIVGYTESMAFYTIRRVKALGLDGMLDYLYSPENHDLPEGLTEAQKELFSPDLLRLQFTKHRHTPKGALKPNPDVLLDIMRQVAASREHTIYVGDSLMKDIAMAQDAGVTDVFAKYGVAQYRDSYKLLQEVSHWPRPQVEQESKVKIEATETLKHFFGELIDYFQFIPYEKV